MLHCSLCLDPSPLREIQHYIPSSGMSLGQENGLCQQAHPKISFRNKQHLPVTMQERHLKPFTEVRYVRPIPILMKYEAYVRRLIGGLNC
jgi:hypothetical protein